MYSVEVLQLVKGFLFPSMPAASLTEKCISHLFTRLKYNVPVFFGPVFLIQRLTKLHSIMTNK